MPLLMLKDLPRYECLLKASEQYPGFDPASGDAFLNLLRTGDEVFAEVSNFFTKHHLSQGRFIVLMLLQRPCDEPATPASLADESRVTRATMTGLIDTLVKDGLVNRETDKSDRRTRHVRLTPRGKKFVKKMLPDYFLCVSAVMQPLNVSERKEIVRLLQKIQQHLGRSKNPGLREQMNAQERNAGKN